MAKKQIQTGKHTVEVIDLPVEGTMPVRELRAEVGKTIRTMRVTFGAADGPRPTLSPEQVQRDLDDARQKLAEEASWCEHLRELLEGID